MAVTSFSQLLPLSSISKQQVWHTGHADQGLAMSLT